MVKKIDKGSVLWFVFPATPLKKKKTKLEAITEREAFFQEVSVRLEFSAKPGRR